MRNLKLLALIPAVLLCGAPTLSQAAFGIGVSVNIAPPVLPVYAQPPLPAPGYMWTPGYWAWDGSDYYWVPGTWVQPPSEGLLWTPGYWGWNSGAYLWNEGYWGPQVGYYGGVNYGFGYGGVGFGGGYWHGGAFFYNRSVANFGGVHITNVYNAPVQHVQMSRVSFNGGQGGLRYQPSEHERAAMNEHHVAPTGIQNQHQEHAASMPAMHMHQNGGHPQVLTTARAGDFSHPGPGGHAGQSRPNGAAMQMHAAPGRPEGREEPQAHEQQHDQPQQHESHAPAQEHPQQMMRAAPGGEHHEGGGPGEHGGGQPHAQSRPEGGGHEGGGGGHEEPHHE